MGQSPALACPTAFDEIGAPVSISVQVPPAITGNDVAVTLTGVADRKRVTVLLPSVNGLVDVSASMGFLIGDVNNSQSISPTDISQVKAHAGQAVDGDNFRFDLNATGAITAADVSAIKGRITRSLPAVVSIVLPPDPASVASPIDPTVATNILPATAFLYTGANPIQTGVAPGAIVGQRAAVLRGKVQTRAGTVLSGVTITILAHPEFGQTISRADGAFDLAVNGGGQLTVNYQRAGFLPVQRAIVVPWRDYAWLPDVVMIPFDGAVTAIDLNVASMQTARGNPVSDADGTRQATILFPPNTTATMVLANGSTQPLTTLNVRATEYTVGTSGPKAMPAPLPPSSGYTYAAELSVDEAVVAGATEVRFSQPVPTYVENFLGFPVGTVVPSGYYDRQKGQWIASANGRVIKILSITNNLAELDTDGDTLPDDATKLTALGITDPERARLAQLYTSPGQTLWRVPIAHFSPWDFNWPFGPPPGATAPPAPANSNPPVNSQNQECGSVIGCENQSLGESIPAAGTPWSLHYQSERTPGRKDAYTREIKLSGATLPIGLKRIELEISVAGQHFTQNFPAAPNQTYTLIWDGKDAFGRTLHGVQPVTVNLGYVYGGVYLQPSEKPGAVYDALFGHFSYFGTPVSANRERAEVTLSRTWTESVGPWQASAAGMGGWSLSVQHAYDPFSRMLLQGDGRQRRADALAAQTIIATAAGTGLQGFSGDGGPATAAQLNNVAGVAVGPDGSLYIADTGNQRIRRVAPDGIITTVAGNGVFGFSGDGGLATAAQLFDPNEVAIGADGSLFIADYDNNRIRRVGVDGIITTVAGNGVRAFGGDGGLATAAQLNGPANIAVGPDGNLYVSESNRVRRFALGGVINTVVGDGFFQGGGNGGPAAAAQVAGPKGIAFAAGDVFIAEYAGVRRIGPDGTISRMAGTGVEGFSGDGGPATAAQVRRPASVVAGADGSLFIADPTGVRLRRVGPEGIISTIAGTGAPFDGIRTGDGGPATAANLNGPTGVAMGPDGKLYIADNAGRRIRRVDSALPGVSLTDIVIPAEDGGEIYIFNSIGRHLKTLDALTGALRFQFAYSTDGYLISVTDAIGNLTTIERTGAIPAAIVAPGGQRTTLNVNAGGWLLSATNPAGQAHTMSYSVDGLLLTFADPRSQVHQFTYDALGRLTRDDNPAGGSTTLVRTVQSNGYTVTTTSALGRSHAYQVEQLTTGAARRTVTAASGTKTITLINTDGSEQTTYADGSSRTVIKGPDPRWGMLAPVAKSVVLTTPGGRTRTVTTVRTATLSDPNDLFSLTNLTDTLTDNGAVRTRVYSRNGATRTLTDTSAAGRGSIVTLDALGRVTQAQALGLDPVAYTYDSRGLISTITEGSGVAARTTTLAYNAKYELTSVTDALSRTTALTYDSAGRLVTSTLPGARTVTLAYDASGNLTALTPPGKSAHGFGYTAIDETASYTPPDLGSGTTTTQFTYDTDRALTRVTRPDGQLIDVAYDTAGRPGTVTIARGAIGYSYSPTTDQLTGITAPGGLGLSYTRDSELLTGVVWTGAVAGATAYTYNNDLRVTTETVNAANSVSFTYAADGLLSGAGSLALTRNAQNGLLTGSTLGSVTDSLTYNTLAERSNYSASYNAAAIYNAAYTRDALGRITQMVETIGGVTTTFGYGYDIAGRLNAVSKDAVPISTYSYDLNGNRTARTGPTLAATVDAQDRLTSYGTTTYSYTANGELLGKVSGAENTAYEYDALGNLLKVTLPNATVIDYLIDGVNRRIGKKVNGTLVQGFLYQGALRPVAELDGSNVVVSRFIYGTRVNVPDYLIKGGVTYRIIADHLGSPRLVVDVATGNVAQRIDYDEFGNVATDTSPGFQPFGFAGGMYDKDTKLVRFGARDYDAETGRWTAKDPITFAGRDTNLYAYVRGDPVNAVDVDGLCPVKPGGTLYTSSHNLRLLPVSNINATPVNNWFPVGSTVTFLGYSNGLVMVSATLANGSTVVGYALPSNFATTAPATEYSAPGNPMSNQAYPSSGVGIKG
ncbi:MAG: hypothetical protein IPP88_07950 [Betaproteobacteria bacterium]|nr:hypothetical protein [Betaproteobacteria bacterium]